MKAVPPKRAPAHIVEPRLDEARIEQMWESIANAVDAQSSQPAHSSRSSHSPAPVRSWSVGVYALVAAVALLVVFGVVFLRRPAANPIAGLIVETHEAGQSIALPDGSALAIAPRTRLRVVAAGADDVRVRLEHGTITCDVVPARARRFVVEAGATEVEVKGTRFDVEVGDAVTGTSPSVAVRVERGAVEVRDGERASVANLKSGESWASHVVAPAPLREPPSAAPPPAPEPAPPPEPAPAISGTNRRSAPSPSARELFEQADAAQLDGHPAEAAASFDALRRKYPSDARAGLASYQLARIRLRKLGDPRGAAEAFSFALAHDPSGAFREDAAAGLVEALERAGDGPGCRRAKTDFLARHPSSPLAASVGARCNDP